MRSMKQILVRDYHEERLKAMQQELSPTGLTSQLTNSCIEELIRLRDQGFIEKGEITHTTLKYALGEIFPVEEETKLYTLPGVLAERYSLADIKLMLGQLEKNSQLEFDTLLSTMIHDVKRLKEDGRLYVHGGEGVTYRMLKAALEEVLVEKTPVNSEPVKTSILSRTPFEFKLADVWPTIDRSNYSSEDRYDMEQEVELLTEVLNKLGLETYTKFMELKKYRTTSLTKFNDMLVDKGLILSWIVKES